MSSGSAKITRRRLLLGVASICVGAAGTAYVFRGREDAAPPELIEAAKDLFGDADGARWLGEAYLRVDPASTRDQLAQRILEGRRGRPSTARELRQMIRTDYAAGRTVIVQGWYFARSEAAAAALIALDG